MSYWKYLPGLEDIEYRYSEMLRSVNDSSVVVEAGCGLGRGVHYMMEAFKEKGVKPKLYAFDTFGENHSHSQFCDGNPKFTDWDEPFDNWTARIGGSTRLLDQFAFHLKNSPASEYLTDWAQFPHWTVAEEFKDNSVDYVFAFGGTSKKAIEEEVRKWWPKLKSGGLIMTSPLNYGDIHRPVMKKK
ncbi:hypothetical protein E3A20_20710 [Planctomyces bekefii]|uniref:Methyltransferase n=1 Tax=Planctomyces bekefii TaxID=1653850 RepID=A0A5C6M226_9PLAN|nr:hypothetical protein E3A20_20710 [Planctomyces bekefii]